MIESFVATGEEGAGEWVAPTHFNVRTYLAGFTAGYISEQVAITALTAGALQAAKVGVRTGKVLRDAAKGIKPILEAANHLRTKAQKAKNSIFRSFSQDVGPDTEDVRNLKITVEKLYSSCN